jgi:hypothetical protein
MLLKYMKLVTLGNCVNSFSASSNFDRLVGHWLVSGRALHRYSRC